MTDHVPSRRSPGLRPPRLLSASPIRTLALLALCAACIQGPITNIFNFDGALAEMAHFGLQPATFFAVSVIVFELIASATVVFGFLRRVGALALAGFTFLATFIAVRFWEMAPGMERMMATNSFFEHIGLIVAFVVVAAMDLDSGAGR
ncbi:DoxX family protein [Rhizobium bangladeshense]|nr:DoxX family protein [Rhizobium bangladeshense]